MFATYDAKVHGKQTVQYVDVRKLVMDDTLNIRWHKGATIEGVKIEVDTRDIPGMGFQIKEKGGIERPLLLSRREDDTLVVIQGNRRTSGGQWLLKNDPEAREGTELFKQLTKQTPAIILQKLSFEEEKLLVNDQAGNKSYERSEVYRDVENRRKSGQKFDQIARECVDQIAAVTGARKQLTDYRAIPAEQHELRKKKLVSWLNGTLRTYWMNGSACGLPVRKAILLSEMMNDGLLHKKDEKGVLQFIGEKPFFITTKNTQKRFGELSQARDDDDKAGKWNDITGGPKMSDLMKKFHDEDFDEAGNFKEKEKPVKNGYTQNDCKQMVTDGKVKSPAMRAAMQAVSGEFTGNLFEIDDALLQMQLKENLFLQYRPMLQENLLKDALVQVFLANDLLQFEALLASNCREEQELKVA